MVNPLENLRDIHLPPPITWWPWAFGWYILIGLIFLLGLSGFYFIYRKRRGAFFKRQALLLLAEYKKQYEKDGNAQAAAAKIAALLKRVALIYFPRQQVAGLKGDAWIDFLACQSLQNQGKFKRFYVSAKNKLLSKFVAGVELGKRFNIDFHRLRYCLLILPYENQAQPRPLSKLANERDERRDAKQSPEVTTMSHNDLLATSQGFETRSKDDVSLLFTYAAIWIKQRGVPCSN